MLNIILYILIGSGIGYFIFLIYKKWPQIQKEDSSPIRFSTNSIKKAPQKLFLHSKQIVRKCKQWRRKNYKFFDGRLKSVLNKIKKINFISVKKFFKKGKNRIDIISKFLGKKIQKIVITVRTIKFSKTSKPKPLFETKLLEKDEAPFFEKEESNPKIFDIKKTKNFFSSIASKTRKKIRKAKIKIPVVFLKEFKQKIKTTSCFARQNLIGKAKSRFISKENQKIKKQLSRTEKAIVDPESYLGELLKRTEEEEIISKETKNLSSKDDIIKKPLAEPVAKKKIRIIKLIKMLKGLKATRNKLVKAIKDVSNRRMEARTLKRTEKGIKDKKTNKESKIFEKKKVEKKSKMVKENKQFLDFPQIEISEEAIKKIENKLISEIMEDSKNIEAYKKLGKIYYNQDKYHYAIECFKAALKLGSGDKKVKDLLKECEEKSASPR